MSVNELPSRSIQSRGIRGTALAFSFAAMLAAALPGCDGGKLHDALQEDAATSGTILSALSRAQTEQGDAGALTPSPQPSGTTPGFALTVTPSSPAVTNGGTATVTLDAAQPFTEVTASVEGLSGLYQFTLPSAVTSVTLQLTLDQDIRQPTITFLFTAGDGTNYGPVAQQSFDIIIVGTGDIQVSLTFDQQDDVDLSVVDPAGDTVYYANPTVPSGGTLDLDANPACGPPFGNSENITWPDGAALIGTYSVYIDLFQSCFGTAVNYTLTITVVGNDPVIISGTLQASDAGLGPQLITTFDVTAP